MILVGLTGGIASGKSTVSSILKNDFNCRVIDADVIAREVVEPGKRAYNLIVEEFGAAVITDSGAINREKLGEIIFKDEARRKKLNAIVHPAIGKAIFWKVLLSFLSGHRFIILDIPLLFESKTWTYITSPNVVVYCSKETQLKRLMKRNNLSQGDAQSRIDSQMSLEGKRCQADIVIGNDGTLDDTYKQVEKLHKNLDKSKKYLFARATLIIVCSCLFAFGYKLLL